MAGVTIRPAVLRDACFVAASMREADRAEIAAVVDMREPASVAALLLAQSGPMAFVAYIGRDPVCAFGVARLYEHVGAGWAFGTKRMRRVVPAVTAHCLQVIAPAMVRQGYRRLEVRTAADHDISHRWLAGMGAKRETEPYEFGRNGEMFVTYAWSRKAWVGNERKAKRRAR